MTDIPGSVGDVAAAETGLARSARDSTNDLGAGDGASFNRGGHLTWNDSQYFRERAAVERALAKAPGDPKVAAVHDELAERYEALVREGKRPILRIVTARASEAA
jgi:hypothetical protein